MTTRSGAEGAEGAEGATQSGQLSKEEKYYLQSTTLEHIKGNLAKLYEQSLTALMQAQQQSQVLSAFSNMNDAFGGMSMSKSEEIEATEKKVQLMHTIKINGMMVHVLKSAVEGDKPAYERAKGALQTYLLQELDLYDDAKAKLKDKDGKMFKSDEALFYHANQINDHSYNFAYIDFTASIKPLWQSKDEAQPAQEGKSGIIQMCGFLSCNNAGVDFQQCSRCKTIRYCSKKCHRADWKQHTQVCASSSDGKKKKSK